jgi:hypothetical protein
VTVPTESGADASVVRRCERCRNASEEHCCVCCGKELDRPRDLSAKHFLTEAVVAATDVDSALIASFRSLLTKPGELTVQYLGGDRSRFMAPFRLFLLCNLIYFVAAAQLDIGVLTVPLRVQTGQMPYAGVSRGMVNEHLHMEAPAMTLEAGAARDSIKNIFAAKYDGATAGIGKVIVALLIPFYAILFQLLYAGQRRFFAEHLILATHLTAFLLVAIPALGVVASVTHRAFPASGDHELWFSAFFTATFSAYAYLAQRVVYETDRRSAAIRTVILTASIAPILVALKFVLFLVTLYWIA